MPTLESTEPEPTDHWDRVARIAQSATHALGADHRVRLRVILCMALAVVCIAMAPLPWAAIGTVAMLVLALDWTRK